MRASAISLGYARFPNTVVGDKGASENLDFECQSKDFNLQSIFTCQLNDWRADDQDLVADCQVTEDPAEVVTEDPRPEQLLSWSGLAIMSRFIDQNTGFICLNLVRSDTPHARICHRLALVPCLYHPVFPSTVTYNHPIKQNATMQAVSSRVAREINSEKSRWIATQTTWTLSNSG